MNVHPLGWTYGLNLLDFKELDIDSVSIGLFPIVEPLTLMAKHLIEIVFVCIYTHPWFVDGLGLAVVGKVGAVVVA